MRLHLVNNQNGALAPFHLPAKGDGAVERVIKNLVEYDKRGRRLVEEAEEERRSVLAHMDDYKKELAKQYHEREQEKVEQFRQQAQVEKEEALAAARARHEEALGRLKRTTGRTARGGSPKS